MRHGASVDTKKKWPERKYLRYRLLGRFRSHQPLEIGIERFYFSTDAATMAEKMERAKQAADVRLEQLQHQHGPSWTIWYEEGEGRHNQKLRESE